MLFTWAVESVLLGLVGLSLTSSPADLWVSLMVLLVSVLTLVLLIAITAMGTPPLLHEVAVAHLTFVSGHIITCFVLAFDPRLNPWPGVMQRSLVLSYISVVGLVAFGMAFSSTGGAPTWLMLHPRATMGLFWPLSTILLGAEACSWGVLFLTSPLILSLAIFAALDWGLVYSSIALAATGLMFFYELFINEVVHGFVWGRIVVLGACFLVQIAWILAPFLMPPTPPVPSTTPLSAPLMDLRMRKRN